MTVSSSSLLPSEQEQFEQQGYLILRQLFQREEVNTFREHFMQVRERGPQPGDETPLDVTHPDPLKRYPRLMMMHRWDEVALHFLLDARLHDVLVALVQSEPFAVQTMLYFKPPHARGQALHQDNYFLRVRPGTCIAAWLALDDCDEANGCLQVLPATQSWPILCTIPADETQSFTANTVPVPADKTALPMVMQAGDVLFFNGSLVHGSMPNSTEDRFRRSLIGHYIVGEAEMVGRWYHPVLRFDGSDVTLGTSPGSTPCGVWNEDQGQTRIVLTGTEVVDPDAHE
jgi:phytanoyl-CoA hydroxylase